MGNAKHQWGQPRSAALYYDYVETFPRVRGNKKGALPQAVNAHMVKGIIVSAL
jgi:hypothetical protein